MPEQPIPNFDLPSDDIAFPDGRYLFALGAVRPVNGEDGSLEAVLNDLWVIKYIGTEAQPANDVRIKVKEGKEVLMSQRGVRVVERYPLPTKLPKLAWRAKAFFAKFDSVVEQNTGKIDDYGQPILKKQVDWSRVKTHYGQVFTANMAYVTGKAGKRYRNIDYETIELTGQKIPANEMELIEKRYEEKRKAEEVTSAESTAAPGLPDLPF